MRKLFCLCVGMALLGLHDPVSAQSGGYYGPWNDPFPYSTGVWSSGVNTNAQSSAYDYSPLQLYSVGGSDRYQPAKPYVIAHRGQVSLKNGWPENSEAAVKLAYNNNIKLVEIDVQVSADGVPMALHDNTPARVTGGNLTLPVNTYDAATLETQLIRIKNPLYGTSGNTDQSQYYPPNQSSSYSVSIQSIQQIMGGCNATDWKKDMTFFLDPKNLASAQAVVKMAMNNAGCSQQIVMKTYPAYYSADDVWSVTQGATAAQMANLGTMRVMPVENYINDMTDCEGSRALCLVGALDAISDVEAWGAHFEVQAVEIPGAWSDNWVTFAGLVKTSLAMESNLLPNNSYTPVISAGYRYDDYNIYDPSSGKTVAYDWDMNGNAQVDTGNQARRWACAQLPYIQRITYAGYITTDWPLQEIACMEGYATTPYEWGAPVNSFRL